MPSVGGRVDHAPEQEGVVAIQVHIVVAVRRGREVKRQIQGSRGRLAILHLHGDGVGADGIGAAGGARSARYADDLRRTSVADQLQTARQSAGRYAPGVGSYSTCRADPRPIR